MHVPARPLSFGQVSAGRSEYVCGMSICCLCVCVCEGISCVRTHNKDVGLHVFVCVRVRVCVCVNMCISLVCSRGQCQF